MSNNYNYNKYEDLSRSGNKFDNGSGYHSDSECSQGRGHLKQDYECIYEYSVYDMEMDLLNTYSSIYKFRNNTIKDIKTIEQIEEKYAKIKEKKEFVLSDDVKKLIGDIDEEIKNYKLLLNQEVEKQEWDKKPKSFRLGVGVGVGVSLVMGGFMYLWKGDK